MSNQESCIDNRQIPIVLGYDTDFESYAIDGDRSKETVYFGGLYNKVSPFLAVYCDKDPLNRLAWA